MEKGKCVAPSKRSAILPPLKKVAFSSQALVQLRKHRSEAAAIMVKIDRYAQTGARNVKALVGRPGKRLRVGDYRVIFEESESEFEF